MGSLKSVSLNSNGANFRDPQLYSVLDMEADYKPKLVRPHLKVYDTVEYNV